MSGRLNKSFLKYLGFFKEKKNALLSYFLKFNHNDTNATEH